MSVYIRGPLIAGMGTLPNWTSEPHERIASALSCTQHPTNIENSKLAFTVCNLFIKDQICFLCIGILVVTEEVSQIVFIWTFLYNPHIYAWTVIHLENTHTHTENTLLGLTDVQRREWESVYVFDGRLTFSVQHPGLAFKSTLDGLSCCQG